MTLPRRLSSTAPWNNLRLRAALLRQLREFFHRRGLLEVETPILSADTVVDRHLDPFPVQDRWLQTSPEFGMKRLLSAGTPAIYQIAHVFRQEEAGPLHNPEFTMVEWYQPGDGMAEGMQFLSDLCQEMLGRGPAEQLSYAEAFRRYAGLDPLRADTAAVAATARASCAAPENMAADDRDGWLDLLLGERVAPQLGQTRPAIVYDYPASQAALARIRPGEPPLAERFELYVQGIELANGYHELLDAGELQRRSAAANAQRRADGREALPEHNRLLAALEAGLPPAVGVALGFDRLAMLAAGADDLRQVMAFPFDRA